MSNGLPLPPVHKDSLLSGTYQQLLDFFTERLTSRDEAEQRLAKEQAMLLHGNEVTFGDFQIAWTLDQNTISKQLDNIRDGKDNQVKLGAFGAIFFMRYCSLVAREGLLPQVNIGLTKYFVLIRPDDWYDKATKGLES